MGSDQLRYQLQSQIWSTSTMLNPPTLCVTINPSNIHDPIAQVFAGADVNLDDFFACVGPDAETQANNIAADPYAAAKFFHFLIQIIFKTLFIVQVLKFHMMAGVGILGHLSAYFGTVELQGRETLHLHLLVWLDGAPSADEMCEWLKDKSFHEKVKRYIHVNLHAYILGWKIQSLLMRFQR